MTEVISALLETLESLQMRMEDLDYTALIQILDEAEKSAQRDEETFKTSLSLLTGLLDHHYPTGRKKRSSIAHLVTESIERLLLSLPRTAEESRRFLLMDHSSYNKNFLRNSCPQAQSTLVVDAQGFPPEGDESLARALVEAHKSGFRNVILARLRGHRFVGCGLGPEIGDFRMDVYGSSGDYLASGLDGGEIIVHGSAQDQLGNIMKSGCLVVHGDVGQAFLYGAKGGEIYVLGNAAGRPLINAVGNPRVVINGTALDYLAESFMAGDPLEGGGFVILNGVEYNWEGRLVEKDAPYPGGNLFSLASGGAVYIRDPHQKVGEDQLNGGMFAPLTDKDWEVILPCLQENERLFGIPIHELLTIREKPKAPHEIYRKVQAIPLKTLEA